MIAGLHIQDRVNPSAAQPPRRQAGGGYRASDGLAAAIDCAEQNVDSSAFTFDVPTAR